MADGWYATGIVLVTEIRTCKCGETYSAPNPSLMVEYESGTRRVRRHYKPGTDEFADLPRSEVEVHSGVVACTACFIPGTPEAAQRFRDGLRKKNAEAIAERRRAEREKASGIKAISLEDI